MANTTNKARRVSVNELYNVWAKNYDEENNLLMFLEQQVTKNLFNFKGKEILDLGCGTGRYSIPLSKFNKVTAVDFNSKMLDLAGKKAEKAGLKIEFINQDITKFKSNKKFDVIISMLVQDQIKDLKKVAEVIFSVSRAGTDLFISNVHPNIISKITKKGKSEILKGYLIQEYFHSPHEYEQVFGKFGFKLIKTKEIIFEKKYFELIEAQIELRNQALGIIYHFGRVR
jgi:2-polyprenyl-3-methyl-5-hydroxy-6-metoxy-1,4-benzoquinol methylase